VIIKLNGGNVWAGIINSVGIWKP